MTNVRENRDAKQRYRRYAIRRYVRYGYDLSRSSCRERASKLFSRHEIAELTWLPDLSFKDRSAGTAKNSIEL